LESKISDRLRAARESLFLGVKLSNQGSYARRAPSPDSLPLFANAREKLEEVLAEIPTHREALMMMAQLSECLLDYDDAVGLLTRAFDAGEPKSKKSLKRLARLRENSHEWQALGLTPDMLRRLGDHLDAEGVTPGETTLRHTRDWLVENHIDDPEAVVAALERRGAFSDFQVLANVCYG
jgi:hypothetical protein